MSDTLRVLTLIIWPVAWLLMFWAYRRQTRNVKVLKAALREAMKLAGLPDHTGLTREDVELLDELILETPPSNPRRRQLIHMRYWVGHVVPEKREKASPLERLARDLRESRELSKWLNSLS